MAERPEIHWDMVMREQFRTESDRACVILCAALLDQALETILKSRLAPTSTATDELLEGAYAPISSFNARIDLAHRLGLISTKLCRDLHSVRKIRNDFAHNISGCSFEDSSVHHRVTELSRSLRLIERNPDVRTTFPKGIRGDFQMMMSWMLWHLAVMPRLVTSIEPASYEPPYWSQAELDVAEKEYKSRKKLA